jgi:hypothetical protein
MSSEYREKWEAIVLFQPHLQAATLWPKIACKAKNIGFGFHVQPIVPLWPKILSFSFSHIFRQAATLSACTGTTPLPTQQFLPSPKNEERIRNTQTGFDNDSRHLSIY